LRGLRRDLVDRFHRGVVDPRAAQHQALQRVLASLRGTRTEQNFSLTSVQDLAGLRAAVPIRSYDDHAAGLHALAAGDERALLAEPVRSFVKTSGTTGVPKLLPVTDTWAREVADAQALWVLAMVAEQEAVTRGRALTTVGAATEGLTPSGKPYGSNTGRMQRAQPWLVRRRMAVPFDVFTLPDAELRHYCLLRLALAQDVRTWTTANPSTLLVLARAFQQHRDALERDLADGTLCHGPARELPAAWRWRWWLRLRRRRLPEWRLTAAWELASINCWKGGAAPFFIERLPAALGATVPVREVGISASEGYFAIPLHSSWTGGVAWADGHLLELVADDGQVFGLHDVPVGATYRLVISTTAGLLRYDMNDLVRVEGRYGATPVLSFVGKGRDVLSVTGEKVAEAQAAQAVSRSLRGEPVGFSVGVRLAEVSTYVVAVEGAVVDAAVFDTALCALNNEYASKRSSGRLTQAQALVVPDGTFARYRAERLAQGAVDGQVKDPVLVHGEAFERLLAGWLEVS